MEKIYTDISDFETVRRAGAVYVDKTGLVLPIIDGSVGTQFFLSRPRRFGKTLLLSTIRCIFEGRRELFEGLAIAGPDAAWDWEGETCPVVSLDMSMCSGGSLEEVEANVADALRCAAKTAGVPLHSDEVELRVKFKRLVEDAAAASPTGKCVLLVDEYDKPLTRFVGTPEVRPYREFLRGFYSAVKAAGPLLRFSLMTGVSKFSKVSIFSDLNNLVDLTMSPLATTLLGYTHGEVRANFPGRLAALGAAYGTDAEGAFALLAENYDGYRFDGRLVPVFNPVSLGRALADGEIGDYWFETGTPGWLMSYARKAPVRTDGVELTQAGLGTFEPEAPDMTAVLFQTGYLTIQGARGMGAARSYTLGLPNREVSAGFSRWLANAYSRAASQQTSAWQAECTRAVEEGDVELFAGTLQSYFASLGYDIQDRIPEQGYQCMVVAVLRFVGVRVGAEVTTSRGRVDMVCEAERHVLVAEMKVASGDEAGEAAAREAIAQIRAKGYADPYRADATSGRRRVHLIGMAFDCEVHNLGAWTAEEL